MAEIDEDSRRVIQVGARLDEPGRPQPSRPPRREPADYPDIPQAYLEIAQNYTNPLLMGPPLCDELVALVLHLYTEEEAELVRHIKSPAGKTAAAMARAVRRPVEEVHPILKRLAYEKFVLLAYNLAGQRRYSLWPVLPGLFEMALMRPSLDTLTDWHRRFAELFMALYETGYLADYVERPLHGVRYLPVGETIDTHPQALPSDRLEEILDGYDAFAVGLCQCRMAERLVGRGCNHSLENCAAFGDSAGYLVRHGKMRPVEKRELLEIKAEAAAAGLANFVAEVKVGSIRTGGSCSCCGCCCGGLRTISQLNAPGLIAPPHFVPDVDGARCTHCALCARACPTGAMVIEPRQKTHQHLRERCIGCGLCAAACGQQAAIRMEPLPNYREPPGHLVAAGLQMVPNYLRNAWSVWRNQR